MHKTPPRLNERFFNNWFTHVKALQEKTKVLESQQRASGPSNADASTQPASTATSQDADNNAQPASLTQKLHERHGIQWRGFGEVDYKVLNQRTSELGTYGSLRITGCVANASGAILLYELNPVRRLDLNYVAEYGSSDKS
jgi:hypothetical protein